MSDDGHFEFYDLWENGATYSLAYGRNGFSTKIHIEPIDEVLFLKNAYRSLSGAIFQLFVLTITTKSEISSIKYVYITPNISLSNKLRVWRLVQCDKGMSLKSSKWAGYIKSLNYCTNIQIGRPLYNWLQTKINAFKMFTHELCNMSDISDINLLIHILVNNWKIIVKKEVYLYTWNANTNEIYYTN